MTDSTFVLAPGAPNVAEFFDGQGRPAIHYRFTALAAASLYTTTADMSRFLAAHLQGANGEPAGRGVLRPQTVKQMRVAQASQFGVDIWGLGTMLFVPNNAGDYVIGHDGSNEPAINTAARLDPATGDGIIVLETGNRVLATTIAGEWVFWRTGNLDFLTLTIEFAGALKVLAAGWLLITLAAIAIAWRARRRRIRNASG
jgi:CubicO group peptidase (beta-lactamase class C family)